MKKNFKELLESSDTPILIDFFATWCGPCKAVAPTLKEVATDLSGRLKVIKVDVDKNPALAQKFQIRGVPTFVLFEKGNPVWRKSGVMSARDFKAELEPHLKN